MTKKIAPSILSADFSKLGDEIVSVEKAGADMIHIDVMDGHYVPNITMGPLIVEAVKKVTTLPLDVHLMIEKPDLFIDDFADAGADMISVHAEVCPHLNRTIQHILEKKVIPGVALNPSTPLECLYWVMSQLKFILIMSVNPGFGGQSFIESSIDKIIQIKQKIVEKQLNINIQVDGGVNRNTISDISKAGCDIFVAGSAIFGKEDYQKAIDDLKEFLC
ncbi:MAG: ribulose-phosphate 3-epimerase [Candidatus Magnetomorum sp.]|nr:ribulose-phosphate 3-epimerase [Candidatus Magnetomorum sp.]